MASDELDGSLHVVKTIGMSVRSFCGELDAIPGRAGELKKIHRFHIYPVMFYRTNLWRHSKRVARTVRFFGQRINQLYGNILDLLKAELMAEIHDDPELITGDHQVCLKNLMTPEQLAALEEEAVQAAATLSRRFPSHICGYRYHELLLEQMGRKTLESQLVQFADKLDACGEGFHELLAGNVVFATPLIRDGHVMELPPDSYCRYFSTFPQKYPAIASLEPFERLEVAPPGQRDWKALAMNSSLHRLETVDLPTGYFLYDLWKRIQLSDPEERGALTTQLEFPKASAALSAAFFCCLKKSFNSKSGRGDS